MSVAFSLRLTLASPISFKCTRHTCNIGTAYITSLNFLVKVRAYDTPAMNKKTPFPYINTTSTSALFLVVEVWYTMSMPPLIWRNYKARPAKWWIMRGMCVVIVGPREECALHKKRRATPGRDKIQLAHKYIGVLPSENSAVTLSKKWVLTSVWAAWNAFGTRGPQ